MAKKKTPQNNTEGFVQTNTVSRLLEYRDIRTWVTKQVAAEDLARRFMTWADRKDSYRISDFLDEEGINPNEFEREKDKYPQLKLANEYALRRLASRREIGAMLGKLKENTVFRTMPHYCHIDKEQLEWRTQIAAKARADQELNTKHMVVLREMPSNPKVPERKKQ